MERPIAVQSPRNRHRLGGNCTVLDLAKPTPITASPHDTIRVAMNLMSKHKIGSVIVVERVGRKPVGVFTLQDVLLRVAIPDVDKNGPLASVMTPHPQTINADTSVHEAALLMAKTGLRHLLIVDDAGALTGVISKNDLYELLCNACVTIRNPSSRRFVLSGT